MITTNQQWEANQEPLQFATYGTPVNIPNNYGGQPYGDKNVTYNTNSGNYNDQPYGDKNFTTTNLRNYGGQVYGDKNFTANYGGQPYNNQYFTPGNYDYGDPYGDKNFIYTDIKAQQQQQPVLTSPYTSPQNGFTITNDGNMMMPADRNSMNITNNIGQYSYTSDASFVPNNNNNNESTQFTQLSNVYKHANGTYYHMNWNQQPRYRNEFTPSVATTTSNSTPPVAPPSSNLTTFGSIMSGEGYFDDDSQSWEEMNEFKYQNDSWSVAENDSMDDNHEVMANNQNQVNESPTMQGSINIGEGGVFIMPPNISKFTFPLSIAEQNDGHQKIIKNFKINMAKLLIRAIKRDDQKMYKTILQYYNTSDIPINEMDVDGMTILMAACQFGKFYLVRFCLDNEADIHVKDHNDKTALMHCCMKQSDNAYAKAYLLIEHSAIVDECDANGTTPLMLAVLHGHTSVVKLLLANGADPNLKNKWRYTALMYAVEKNKIKEARILLAHPETRINTKNQFGQNILMRAAQLGHQELICVLMNPLSTNLYNKRFQIFDVDGKGETCFHYAKHEGILELMIQLAQLRTKKELKRIVKNLEKNKTVQIFKRMSQTLESIKNE